MNKRKPTDELTNLPGSEEQPTHFSRKFLQNKKRLKESDSQIYLKDTIENDKIIQILEELGPS